MIRLTQILFGLFLALGGLTLILGTPELGFPCFLLALVFLLVSERMKECAEPRIGSEADSQSEPDKHASGYSLHWLAPRSDGHTYKTDYQEEVSNRRG